MRTIVILLLLSFSSGTAARGGETVTCDGSVVLRGLSDADLDARYCAISKLRWEAGRRTMEHWSPENNAESNRCISVLADMAREQLQRHRASPRCRERP